MRRLLVLGIALVSACGTAEAPATPPVSTPPGSTPPVLPPPAAPTPAVIDPCSVHAANFRAALASASGACTTSAECACYNPVVGEAGCGGVTDIATATRLAAIEAAFHADGCPWPHLCGPMACEPSCVAGRCVNAPPSTGVGGS